MNFNNLSGKHRKWSVFATTEANLLNFSWYCRMSGFKSVHLQMRTFLSQKHPILKFYSNDASTFPINISFMQYWIWSRTGFPSRIFSPFRWNILLSSKSAGIQSFSDLSVKKTIISLFRRSLFSVNSLWKSLPSKVVKPSSISVRLLWIKDDAWGDAINTTQSLLGSSSLSFSFSNKTSTIFLNSAILRKLPRR